jgi:hypothetical protein
MARLYVIRWLGDVFSEPIEDVIHFIQRYRTPLLILSVTIVVFTIWRESRRTGETEISALAHLDEELEPDEETDQ